jgi:hypothetical protein
VGERSLHTREVAGSKPAAPILEGPALRGLPSFGAHDVADVRRGLDAWTALAEGPAYNILLQRRLAAAGLNTAGAISSLAGARAATDLAYTPEADDEPEVPLGAFLNIKVMDDGRRMAMMSVVRGSDSKYTGVPDLPAIEHLLAARFGCWDDDVDHPDSFVVETE